MYVSKHRKLFISAKTFYLRHTDIYTNQKKNRYGKDFIYDIIL